MQDELGCDIGQGHYESHATALDRNELGALLVVGGWVPRRNTQSSSCYTRLVIPGLYRVAIRDTVISVIVSFRHKGLERLHRDGSKKGVQAAHVPKLIRILSALDVAQTPSDLAIPSFRTHSLKGEMAGHWSLWVDGNWRVTFRFNDGDVELVDYQDYH